MSNAVKKKSDTARLYKEGLEPAEKERYFKKIEKISMDPYDVTDLLPDWSFLPKITYPDIVNYLLFTPSPYTSEDLKSYKSLEAYNQMVSSPLTKTQQKSIIAMGDFGERREEAMDKLRDSKRVTQEKAYWLLPNCLKNMEYKECKDTDFISARTLKKKLDEKVGAVGETGHSGKRILSKKTIGATAPSPTPEEASNLLKSLDIGGARCGKFSLIDPYADGFIPNADKITFPAILTDLREDDVNIC
eukprot:gene13402-14777_t